jgi:hypothetical protein
MAMPPQYVLARALFCGNRLGFGVEVIQLALLPL